MVFDKLEPPRRLKSVCVRITNAMTLWRSCINPVNLTLFVQIFHWKRLKTMLPTYLSVKVAKIKESFQSSLSNQESNEH